MNKTLFLPVLVTGLITLASCSSDDSGGSTALSEPIGDLTGTWAIVDSISSSNSFCADTDAYEMIMAQIGNDLVVTSPDGVFNGTVSGNTASWTGTFPRDGGTTTINSLTATISADCSSLTSEATWSWTDGSDSCTGTTSSTGVRTSGGSC